MRGQFTFSKKEVSQFGDRCEASIRNVFRGTKKATEAACQEILDNSMAEVPKDTHTLLMSAFYEVSRRRIKVWAYEAILGYGGNGDPINPRTGQPASTYMVDVHEDLTARHPVGKAKFLEDPVREYATNNFKRTVFKYASESLAGMSD